MIDWRLKRQLAKASGRIAHLRVIVSAMIVWIFFALAALAVWLAAESWSSPRTLPVLFAVLAVGVAFTAGVVTLRRTRNVRWIANRIEARFPELETSLLAAIDVEPDPKTGKIGYLQDRVVGKALGHAYKTGWEQVIPVSRLVRWHIGHALALATFVVSLSLLAETTKSRSFVDSDLELSDASASDKYSIVVEPGDTEVEKGTSLLVMARFTGRLPAEVTLVAHEDEQAVNAQSPAAGTSEAQTGDGAAKEDTAKSTSPADSYVVMTKALNDPLFGGSIANVNRPLTYKIEFAGQQSDSYRVRVFEYPRLERADAALAFPNYTTMGEKYLQDIRRVSAVVGTKVTLKCQLNKQVAKAELHEPEGDPLAMAESAESPTEYSATFVLEKNRKLELKLVDEDGRENKQKIEFVFTALPNNPPDLKLAAPGRDVEVSPLEELDLKAKVFDDFGVTRVGVNFSLAGQKEKELVLGENFPAKERADVMQLVALENLQAKPDELLSYYFWAEDVGPDSQPRRVSSDMFFAEIRPFEEIFREGQAPAGGQGMPSSGNAQQAQQLSELQKEIINATWKIVRREIGSKPTSAFGADVKLLHESQVKALGQATELAQDIQDAQSLRHVDDVLTSMQRAIKELSTAQDESSMAPLRPALDAEQSAYQALLKLRAREHQVVRSQQQQSRGGSSSSRSQQQLQQLDLKDRENRYETERTAQPEEDATEREMRQVLNRLKELAKRQEDLNERVKELEAQLQQAETEEQREELKRQLKRLQEEQEQILRDTDELQQRMEQPENAERMAESAQQLNEARERVRQSSEALREGMVQQAAASGSRAKEEFDELRDEFRKQTSGHFREKMREMQQEAQELEANEKKLAEQMRQMNDPQKRSTSLRDAGQRDHVAERLANQQKEMEKLLQQMRETVEEAEQPQPLLAEQLYEAARNAQQKDVPKNLELTRQMLLRGFDQQAIQQEEPVGRAITELREGVERAARNVLGDEAEALRRAQNELRDLSEHVQEELRRNGQLASESQQRAEEDASGDREGGQPGSKESKGEPSEEQRGSGQPREGERRAGGSGKSASNQKEQDSDQRRAGGSLQEDSSKDEENQPSQNGEDSQSGEKQGSANSRSSEKSSNKSPSGEKGRGKSSSSEPSDSQSAEEASQGGSPDGEQSSGEPSESQSQAQSGQASSSGRSGRDPSAEENQDSQSGERPNGSPVKGSMPRGSSKPGGARRNGSTTGGGESEPSGFDRFSGVTGGEGNQRMLTPFTGEDFRSWSDRLRDVEELLSDPDLSADAARIRERARGIRAESQRHSSTPNWDLVKMDVAEPLVELLNRVSQEVARKSGQESLAPIDRDPVPPEYAESVKKYFERLGSGK